MLDALDYSVKWSVRWWNVCFSLQQLGRVNRWSTCSLTFDGHRFSRVKTRRDRKFGRTPLAFSSTLAYPTTWAVCSRDSCRTAGNQHTPSIHRQCMSWLMAPSSYLGYDLVSLFLWLFYAISRGKSSAISPFLMRESYVTLALLTAPTVTLAN